MRRLLILASAMVFLDVAFFAAIAPLLPTYVDELHLSKSAAGILSASYAVGTLITALPAGYVASRVGPRRTVIAGLLLLGCSSLVFGLVHHIALLDGARFVQGCSGSLIWSGALTWLISSAPEENRGSVIGTALGTAVAGALLGPALGALAASIGTGVVFGSVLGISLALAYAAARTPDSGTPETQPLREVIAALTSRPVVEATIFVGVPSVMFGALEVLVPLRIDSLGGGHGLIAVGFIAGAALEAVLAPIAGRVSDRVGRRTPYVVGLTICAFSMAAMAIAMAVGTVLAALIFSSLGAGICFAPAMAQIADVVAASRLHQGFAAGVSNMAWASGQVLGGIGGGVVANATGYAAPSIGIAALLMATVFYAQRTLDATPVAPSMGR
ncbi:MAG: MFS transporter [Actinobacteria bacterium]|nr:MFS transporter [Actinomycetota bacterium]